MSGSFRRPRQQGSQGEARHCEDLRRLPYRGKEYINSAKTLSKKALAANGIRNAADIVANMRNPGPGMTQLTKRRSRRDGQSDCRVYPETFQ